ncbi:mechanosensitive ion channel [Candidatus Kapabacteria bacterium]|nr:mechanosensitive ion channel [Candidatus Kapabacteria bacterium]
MDSIQLDLSSIQEMLVKFSMNLVAALVVFIIGRIIIGAISNSVRKNLDKKDFEQTKKNFLVGLIRTVLNVVLLVSIAGIMGISTTSILALLGSAGLAIGLALQGSLSNLAGGFLLMVLKPFKVGDVIEAQGITAAVLEINMLNTKLKSPDAKIIYLPNAPLAGGNIINYSEEPKRRLDLTFGIGYSDDIDKAKAILQNIMDTDPRVIKGEANMIKVAALADSSVNFTWRAWVKAEDYWPLNFDMHEKVKKEFDTNNISIPFPQTDVHLFKEN